MSSEHSLPSPDNPDSRSKVQWWLASDLPIRGPHSTAFIAASIGSNGIHSETPACRDDEHLWKGLRDWPEFAGLFPAPTAPRISLWDERLPVVARLIAIYCLFVQPLTTLLVCLSGYIPDIFDPEFTLYATVETLQSLGVGGLCAASAVTLLRHSEYARYLIPLSLTASLFRSFCVCVGAIVLLVFATALPLESVSVEEPYSSEEGMLALFALARIYLGMLLCCVSVGFELYALSWWLVHGQHALFRTSGKLPPPLNKVN